MTGGGEHLHGRRQGDEGDGDAGEGAEQGGARGDPPYDRRRESANHQYEALHEHPGQAGLPGLHRIMGLLQDRHHHDESHDEHMWHADARRQCTHVVAAGALGKTVAEPGVVQGAQTQHRTRRRQYPAEYQRVGHLQDIVQQAGHDQQIDQDVGAVAEECVQVSGHP